MATRTTLTDQTGAYRFSAVPTGDHTLTFELAGFATLVREGIHVGLGFTATVNAEMSPGTVRDSVSVRGSPVVDVSSTAVTTHFDDESSPALPGSRDIFAVLANTPGVAQPKMDVGGNGALALQDYTAYGLRPTPACIATRSKASALAGPTDPATTTSPTTRPSPRSPSRPSAIPRPCPFRATGPIRQQVRRQHLSRQRLRRFPERPDGSRRTSTTTRSCVA